MTVTKQKQSSDTFTPSANAYWREGAKCGNSVCPPMSHALVKANFAPLEVNDNGVPEFACEAAE